MRDQGAYMKFKPFWQTRLPFALELLHHFLNDMRGVLSSMLSEADDADEKNKKWSMFETLFG